MDILTTLAQQFIADTNNDGKIDVSEVMASMANLLSSPQSPIDLNAIIANMQGSGLADIASSWLGNGDNAPISPQQIGELLDSDKLQSFAAALNLDMDSVTEGLSKVIPNLIDQSSSDGQLRTLGSSDLGDLVNQFKNLL